MCGSRHDAADSPCPCPLCLISHVGPCGGDLVPVCAKCNVRHPATRRCRNMFSFQRRSRCAIGNMVAPLVRAPVPAANSHVVHALGPMNCICPYCGSRSWFEEHMSCCANGVIVLPTFPDVPQEFGDIVYCSHVQQHVRGYNMSLALASSGHSVKRVPQGGLFT